MGDEPISAAISGGTSFLNNIVSGIFNARQNAKAFKQQKWLQNNAQEFQRSMWNSANEYNTPSAQIQRLVDAGINPNSAFSGMQGTAQGAQPLGAAGVGSAPNPAYMDYSTFNPSIDMFANLRKTEAEAKEAEANAEGKSIDNETLNERNQMTIKQAQSVIDKNKAEIDSYLASAGLAKAQEQQVREMLPFLLTKSEVEIDNINAATSKYKFEIDQIEEDIKLTKEKVRTEKSAQSANYASAEASESTAEFNRESTNTQRQETTKRAAEAKVADLERKKKEAENRYKTIMYENGIDPEKLNTSSLPGVIFTAINTAKAIKRSSKKRKSK